MYAAVVLWVGIIWGLSRELIRQALDLAQVYDPKFVLLLIASSVVFGLVMKAR